MVPGTMRRHHGWRIGDPSPTLVVLTLSSGSRPRWSSTNRNAIAGKTNSTASDVATSTAPIVPDGAAASSTVSDLGQDVVPLGDAPSDDDRGDRADGGEPCAVMIGPEQQHQRADPAHRGHDHERQRT